MGISDLYMSIGQKRNISHFANIVRIAISDREITSEEIEFLEKVGRKYNISEEQFKEIVKFPNRIPTVAHLDCIERIERLFDLLTMVKADHHIEMEEIAVLRKIVTGLAFPLKDVDRIVDESLKIDLETTDLESFTESVQGLLRLKY